MKKVIVFLLITLCSCGCLVAGCNRQAAVNNNLIDVYHCYSADNSWDVYFDKTKNEILYIESLLLVSPGDNYVDQSSIYYTSLTEYYGCPATVNYFHKYYGTPTSGGYDVSEIFFYQFTVSCEDYESVKALFSNVTYTPKFQTAILGSSSEVITARDGYYAQAVEHIAPCGIWDLRFEI